MLKPLQLTLFLFQNAILFQHLNTRHKQTGKKHVSFSHWSENIQPFTNHRNIRSETTGFHNSWELQSEHGKMQFFSVATLFN